MKRLSFGFLILFTLCFTGSYATPQDRAISLSDRLQADLERIHAAGKFPGATASVVLEDGTAHDLAVGVSDRSAGHRMKPSDRMLLGSVGKTFVSAVALQLVQEKRLDLDARISAHLGGEPWFERLPNAEDITIRMVMNHTSGVPRYVFKKAFIRQVTGRPCRTWQPEDLVGFVLGDRAPFEAGKGWAYSDTNYILLGMIIERVTESKLYTQIASRLLKPHGLRDTIPSDRRSLPGLVNGYPGSGDPLGLKGSTLVNGKFLINPQFEWAGGGYATTSRDLAHWARTLFEGRAFSRSLMKPFLAGVKARLGPGTRYGLGVMIHKTDLGDVYGHGGFFPGYRTEMRYYARHRFALAVQFNTSDQRMIGASPGAVAHRLARVVAAHPAR